MIRNTAFKLKPWEHAVVYSSVLHAFLYSNKPWNAFPCQNLEIDGTPNASEFLSEDLRSVFHKLIEFIVSCTFHKRY